MAALAFLLMLGGAVFAHPAPNSIMRLEFRPGAVHAEYWVPASELAYARAADPGGELPAYLMRHVTAEAVDGARWHLAVESVSETSYLGHPYLVAQLTLSPPAGESGREFVLVDDAVTHEVRNHVVYVVERRGSQSDVLGALQYPERRMVVAAASTRSLAR